MVIVQHIQLYNMDDDKLIAEIVALWYKKLPREIRNTILHYVYYNLKTKCKCGKYKQDINEFVLRNDKYYCICYTCMLRCQVDKQTEINKIWPIIEKDMNDKLGNNTNISKLKTGLNNIIYNNMSPRAYLTLYQQVVSTCLEGNEKDVYILYKWYIYKCKTLNKDKATIKIIHNCMRYLYRSWISSNERIIINTIKLFEITVTASLD